MYYGHHVSLSSCNRKRDSFPCKCSALGDKCRSSRKAAADGLTTEAGVVASFGSAKGCV